MPRTSANTDVSNVDPEFLAEAPEETPLERSEILKISEDDGDFDNFTFVNAHNLSDIAASIDGHGGHKSANPRHQTEALLGIKQSFLDVDEDDLHIEC